MHALLSSLAPQLCSRTQQINRILTAPDLRYRSYDILLNKSHGTHSKAHQAAAPGSCYSPEPMTGSWLCGSMSRAISVPWSAAEGPLRGLAPASMLSSASAVPLRTSAAARAASPLAAAACSSALRLSCGYVKCRPVAATPGQQSVPESSATVSVIVGIKLLTTLDRGCKLRATANHVCKTEPTSLSTEYAMMTAALRCFRRDWLHLEGSAVG